MKITYRLNDVDAVAEQIIQNVKHKTLLIYGEMGVGKTTLIKAIVKALGSKDEVSSPTFSIVNEYEIKNDVIYHFDLYRIQDIEEAYNFGIEDYLYSNHWILIEWPEKVKSLINNFSEIHLKTNEDNSRSLVIN